MSGGPWIAEGSLAVLLGDGVLGFGFWDRSVKTALMGLGLAIVGYLMIELDRRVPY